jgi:HSP20 family protein
MSIIKWNDRTVLPTVTTVFDNFFSDNPDLFQVLSASDSVPAANIVENDKNYTLELAVPGMSKKDLKIEVDNNMICISSEKEESSETSEKNRSFRLPDNVDPEKVSASYNNGILTVEITKTKPDKPPMKTIAIS